MLGPQTKTKAKMFAVNLIILDTVKNIRINAGVQCIQSWQLFVTPWTVACQAPLSMRFSRQEYWSGLPFRTPGNLLIPGIKPTFIGSPALHVESFD